ncbi:hypothetical protein F8388_011529 [Cannabis sativa]|uniref:Uncharacterized protein n=1 Tax=Cannabis sativa TaxID=3483 RepID=A0A7J6DZ03_CANSA|nr:hypothetical protein F8388_011529 [Cannabis sativa]
MEEMVTKIEQRLQETLQQQFKILLDNQERSRTLQESREEVNGAAGTQERGKNKDLVAPFGPQQSGTRDGLRDESNVTSPTQFHHETQGSTQHKVVILIDSEATHNFISKSLVTNLHITIVETKAYEVTMGNGDSKKCEGICENLNIYFQGKNTYLMLKSAVLSLSVFTYGDEINIIITSLIARQTVARSNIGKQVKLFP